MTTKPCSEIAKEIVQEPYTFSLEDGTPRKFSDILTDVEAGILESEITEALQTERTAREEAEKRSEEFKTSRVQAQCTILELEAEVERLKATLTRLEAEGKEKI